VKKDSTKRKCELAWGCDYTKYRSGGSVFTIDRFGSRKKKTQCYVKETEYSGDIDNNPVFDSGSLTEMTLAQCKSECTRKTDSYGRPCVAIEWGDEGKAQSASTKKRCELAWGCDDRMKWSGGSVFMRKDSSSYGSPSRNLNAQCYVEEKEYSDDIENNPVFEYSDELTLAQCQSKCAKKTDSKGRPCVAIEWKDGGEAQKDSKKKQCALAWGCDYTGHWKDGSVFMRTDFDSEEQKRQAGGAETETGDGNERQDIFVGVGSVVAVVAAVVLVVYIRKYFCSQKAGGMKQHMLGSQADEYGATLELSVN